MSFIKLLISVILFSFAFPKSKIGNSPIFTVSPKIQKIAHKIAKENKLLSGAISYAGYEPEQYRNFIELEANATQKELIELTDHSNGVVRCYAFWALTHDSTLNVFDILIKHIKDDEKVESQFGCIGGHRKVGDFFISLVDPEYGSDKSKNLTTTQLTKLDSLLIFTSNNLDARYDAINRAKPTETLYPVLRRMVVEREELNAIVTLAKYKKEQDVSLILNYRNKKVRDDDDGYYFTYKAINEFPHSDFFPFLEERQKVALSKPYYNNQWSSMYSAIATYKNKNAVALLTLPFTNVTNADIRKYHIDFVFGAILENRDPIYDDLLWELWEKENKITPEIFKYLYSKDNDRVFKLAKLSLSNINSIDIISNYESEKDTDNIITLMLNEVLKRDSDIGIKIIKENILEANVHVFPIFSHFAKDNYRWEFIDPLLKRLELEDNPYIYLEIVDVLIAYNDPQSIKKMLALIKSNPALTKDWGGEALKEKLEKNKIK